MRILFLLLLASLPRFIEPSTIIFFNSTRQHPPQPDCHLYLTRDDHSLYTSTPIPADTVLTVSSVLIPMFDLLFHNAIIDEKHHASRLTPYIRPGNESGIQFEARSTHSITPGWLFLRPHSKLGNVRVLPPVNDAPPSISRSHPNVGAFTYLHSVQIVTTKSIEAGDELFLSVDNHDISSPKSSSSSSSRSDANGYQSLYDHADAIISNFFNITEGSQSPREDAFWNYVRSVVVSDSSLRKLLPSSVSQIPEVMSLGGSAYYSQEDATLPLEYLNREGYCVDNIKEGVSGALVDGGAGRGAFATRAIPEGTLLTASPVWEVDRDILDMHDVIVEETERGDLSFEEKELLTRSHVIVGQQLLLNYCFGRKGSKKLYFPLGMGVHFMNHDREKANVEVKWRKEGDDHEEIILEYIAKRDIQADEELFIDYGIEWEEAWKNHMEQFSPPHTTMTNYEPSHLFNRDDLLVRTIAEQQEDPYPENVQTSCFYSYTYANNVQTSTDNMSDDETIDLESEANDASTMTMPFAEPIVHFTADDIDEYESWSTLDYDDIAFKGIPWKLPQTNYPHSYLRPCKVFARVDGEKYMAVMGNHMNLVKEEMIPDVEMTAHVVVGIPREAIMFVDVNYSGDMHLREAFRHEIGIPEDVDRIF